MRTMSREWEQWYNRQCARCGKPTTRSSFRPWKRVFRLLNADGTEYQPTAMDTVLLTDNWSFTLPDDLRAQCKNCGYTWPIFFLAEEQPHIVEIVEIEERSETQLGKDKYRMSNPSQATAVRRLNLEQRWSQSWNVEYEKAKRTRAEIGLQKTFLGNFKGEVERQIKTKYAITEDSTRTFTDELVLTLPAETRVVVTINWKQIWQHGLIKFSHGEEVPFKVAVGLTYDFSQDNE